MNSIYIILVAIYLFKIAININPKLEKASFYKGILFVASVIIFIASFILYVCETIYTR